MRNVLGIAVVASLGLVGTVHAGEPGAVVEGLTLSVQLLPPTAGAGDEVAQVKVTFKNAGTKPLTFFVPEHFAPSSWPSIRLVDAAGAAFIPYESPYQSMWTEGVQGSLPELQPGKTWEVTQGIGLVIRASGSDAELTPLPLEPGKYRVSATYEQKDAKVPVGGKNFEVSTKVVPGLWTGRAVSDAATLDVPRAKVLSLRIDAPKTAMPGGSYPLSVVLRNDRETPVTLKGALRVKVSTKVDGTASARVRLGEPAGELPAGEVQTFTLAPGAEQRFVVELKDLPFAGWRKGAAAKPLTAWVEQGTFALDAVFEGATEADNVPSNGLWRYVNPARVR